MNYSGILVAIGERDDCRDNGDSNEEYLYVYCGREAFISADEMVDQVLEGYTCVLHSRISVSAGCNSLRPVTRRLSISLTINMFLVFR